MPSSEFPLVIFLSVPDDKDGLSHRIGAALEDKIAALGLTEFRSPLFGAMNGLFFESNPFINMKDSALKALDMEIEGFYPKLEWALRDHFGRDIMAKLAFEYIREMSATLDILVVTDAHDRVYEIREIADKIGRDRCVLVNINSSNYIGGGDMQTIFAVITPITFDRDIDLLINSLPKVTSNA